MAVFRSFYRMMKTALFALVVVFVSLNAFAGRLVLKTTNNSPVFIKINASGNFNITDIDGNQCNANWGSSYNNSDYEGTIKCSGGVIIDGVATGYPSDSNTGVMNLLSYTNSYDAIEVVSGKLGDVFPTLGEGVGYQPSFANIMYNLVWKIIPNDLLGPNIYGPVIPNMFKNTFSTNMVWTGSDVYKNYSYDSIPGNLFSRLTGNADSAFYYTFDTSRITEIPSDLFATINDTAERAFYGTFAMTKSLQTIPYNLFRALSGKQVKKEMFALTFGGMYVISGTSHHTASLNIPENFSFYVSGNANANSAFDSTFKDCNLTNIPSNMFASLSGSNVAPEMFKDTFAQNLSLVIPNNFSFYVSGNANANGAFNGTFQYAVRGTVPGDIFASLSGSNVAPHMFDTTFWHSSVSQLGSSEKPFKFYVSGTADYMFYSTFDNCTNLTYLDKSIFSTISGTPKTSMFFRTFSEDTNLYLNDLPENFFGNIYGNQADSMAFATFRNCSKISGSFKSFFKNVTVPVKNGKHVFAESPFVSTFEGTRLSGQIPADIFGSLSGEVDGETDCEGGCWVDYSGLIRTSFKGTNATGYVPAEMVENITYKVFDDTEDSDKSDFIGNTFDSTNMVSVCPAYTYKVITGYEDYWGTSSDNDENIVACKMCPDGKTSISGQNNSVSDCFIDNTPYFTIKTINLTAGTNFKFMISALGSYMVDWGDGTKSVLSTDVEGVEDDDEFYFSHTYTTGGVRTIKVYGNTLAYSNDTEQAAISFYDGTAYEYIEEIRGSIGSVFPTVTLPSNLSSDDFETHPVFYEMCRDCSNLTTIDSDMFSGVTGAIEGMFEETFYGCYDLQSIPSGLFSGITGNASELFYETFYDCDSIESVPPGLFSGISGAARSMFSETFYSCESLKTIPANLFSGVRGAASSLFSSTFEGCSDLEEIPVGLFANVSGAAPYMFSWTFADCDSLSDIPRELFDGVNTTAEYLFSHTFYDCDNNLTSIPADLFKNVSGTPQKGMFDNTFGDSPDIESFTYADGRDPVSYVPSTFFGALENSNYTTASNTNNWVANDMFVNTQILEACPSGTTEFNSKFKTEYSPKVSCVPVTTYDINYVLNGGTIPNSQTNPTSVQINSGTGKIEYPTRSGWNFAGWNISGMDSSTHSYWKNGAWKEFSSQTLTHEQSQWFKNLRSSSGTVTFTAVWQKYCSSGTYYNPTTQTCTDCPSGSYCNGGAGYTDTPQIVGKKTCPTGFTSNMNARNITQCYKNGTTTCAVVNPVVVAANATSVKYATTGNIACKIYPEEDYEDTANVSSCVPDNPDACEVIGMNCNTGYTSTQVTSVLSTKNIPDSFSDYDYIEIEPDGSVECSDNCYRTNKSNGEYDVLLKGHGIVRGRSLCSTTPGTNGQIGTPSLSNGRYCWCKTTLFKENDNDTWSPAISSWVRAKSDNCNGNTYDDYEDCANECSYECSNYVLGESNYEDDTCSVAEQTVRSTLFNDSKTYICQPITYTVSFNTNGGTGGPGANITATYDVPFNVASPTRSGYTFAGWNISGMDNSTHLYGNSSGHAEENNNLTSVNNISYPWYQDLRSTSGTVMFTAQWIANKYTVTYNANGGSVNPGSAQYTVGGNALTLPTPIYSEYNFDGWYTASNEKINSPYTPTDNITLYAHWSLSSCPENAHIEGSECVCNEGYSGSPCSPITYNIRYEGMEDATFGTNHPTSATYDTLFTVDNPTKTGYKFTGWSMYLLPGTVPESVAYNVNGGTDGVSITAVPGEEATFIYYVENLIQFKNLRKTNSSTVKLTAKWTKQCGAGYDVINNNCVCVAPKIEENGVCHDVCPTGYSYKNTTAPAVLPTIEATDSRYKSLAYPSGGSSSNVEDMSNGYYNVVWESGNTKGTLVGTASCTGTTGEVRHETVVPENSFEEAENSGSNCWCKPVSWTPYGEDTQKLSSDWVFFQEDGNACARECSAMCNNFFGTSHYINQRNDVFDNVKITSEDCVPNTYTVTYDANGGSVNPGSAQYTVGGDALTLPTPIYSGYNFDGWYTASEGGTKINSPYVPLEDDIILYAHWSSTSCQENAHIENGACVCNTGTIEYTDSNNNTTTCAEDKFQLTTTEMSSGESFDFDITAAGTFYVNCGEGGTLSGQYVTLSNSGVQIGKINRENTSRSIYSCTYSNSGTHIIRFGGRATGYVDIHKDKCEGVPRSESAICFTQSASKISGITGSLGAIFGSVAEPTIGIGEPMFFSTFRDAINLTGTIPKGLFYGVTGTRDRMFYSTFHGCTGLTGDIPDFSQISGPGQACMFAYTFRGAFGLNGVLSTNSFSNITSSAKELFQSTFKDCSSLNTMSDGNGTVTNYVQAGFLNNFTGYVAQDALSNTGFDDPCPDTTYDVTQSNFRDAGKPWCTPCPSDTSNYYPNSDSGDNDSINKCYTSGSCPATIAECPDNATCHYTGNNTAGRLYYDGSKTYSCDWAQDTINLLYKYNDINDTQITSMCTYENSPFTVLGNSIERPKYRFMGWKYQKVITNQ